MIEKFVDKISKTFSKKTVENAKQAIIEDIQENHVTYVAVGAVGVILTIGLCVLVRNAIGASAPLTPTHTINITYNYYISTAPKT